MHVAVQALCCKCVGCAQQVHVGQQWQCACLLGCSMHAQVVPLLMCDADQACIYFRQYIVGTAMAVCDLLLAMLCCTPAVKVNREPVLPQAQGPAFCWVQES